MSVLDLFPPAYAYAEPAVPTDTRTSRSPHMSHLHYLYFQELHRERLRQAQERGLASTALRARRALAQQLMR